MPIYIGDYLGDTGHLTRAQHGSYLISMFHYWRAGESLPHDKFKAICGKEFDKVSEFYVLEGGRWHHKRIDEELTKARARLESARAKALKGVAARRQTTGGQT